MNEWKLEIQNSQTSLTLKPVTLKCDVTLRLSVTLKYL